MALASSPTFATESRLVVVTRPEREARAWAEALQSRGVLCDTLPLIEIAALPDASPLVLHWQTVSTHLAVMFVSANAVRFSWRPDLRGGLGQLPSVVHRPRYACRFAGSGLAS